MRHPLIYLRHLLRGALALAEERRCLAGWLGGVSRRRLSGFDGEKVFKSPPRRLAFLLIVVFATSALFAQTMPRDPDLERVRGEISQLKAKLADVRRQARSAEHELEAADIELAIRTRELDVAVATQKRIEGERASIERQITTLTPRVTRQKEFLGRRLAALYRFGSLNYLRLLLAVDQRRDPLQAMSMLRYLIQRDGRALSRFEELHRQLDVRRGELADRQQKLAEVRRVVEDRQHAIAAAHAEQERLVAALRTEESGSSKRLADLEEKARRLERLLGVLSLQQSAAPGAAIDVRSVQGALAWPVKGKVIERFGRQRDPRYNTLTTNNGLKIGAAAGTPVRCIFQGTVLFSQWFKGYGNLIIVDHGHRVFSLYGNLKSAAVAAGDRVVAGQPIAGVGESEETPPGFLYFEIRQDNRPEDPQKWLR